MSMLPDQQRPRSTPEQETIWRRRFGVFALYRLAGLALILLGFVTAVGNLLRPGGWPLVGVPCVAAGVVVGMVIPRRLRRQWEAE